MTGEAADGLRIAHVVVTDAFAGVERYVTQTSNELASRGHRLLVVGGSPAAMRAGLVADVEWRPGATIPQAIRSLASTGHQDVVHVHMTKAEYVGLLLARPLNAALVSTRHFARPRGSALPGRLFSRAFNHRVDCQIAISDFVAEHVECKPDVVIRPGVPINDTPYADSSRLVLMVQRLEPEKETLVGFRAWADSALGEEGWRLRVVGDGSERRELQAWVSPQLSHSVEFVGWSDDVPGHFAQAAMLLATAPAEPFGLSVVEAMAAGVPVLAAASGGHLETVGQLEEPALFRPSDIRTAARALSQLARDASARDRLSNTGRNLQRAKFTIQRHTDLLVEAYAELQVGQARAEPAR